ncbi:MFS transporter [Streptomyces sp. NPDC026206]|uniref:MFS transporter n=1 Tax=Streptomyces sp. NPDC026206 TaxID=3157089 RepID=UPI0033D42448
MSRSLSQRGIAVAVVLVGVFLAGLDAVIVNIAIPDFERSFPSSSLTSLSWVLNAYAITLAAFLIPSGRWADQAGRKRVFMIGLVLFTVASLACAAAPTLGALIAARVLEGAGGALMMPTSLGLLLALFPPEKRRTAIALWTSMSGVGAVFAPLIGAVCVQFDWRWVFIINIPIGAVATYLGWKTVPEVREDRRSAQDVLGALVLAATIAVVVAAIVQGPTWGWGGLRVLSLIALGILGIAFIVRRAFRHPAPVIEPALLRIRSVALGNLATLLFNVGFGVTMTGTTLFLTEVWGHSVVRAALEFLPGPVMATALAASGTMLTARFGVRVTGLIGGVVFAASGLWWAVMLDDSSDYVTGFLPGMAIGGLAVGLVMPAWSMATTTALPTERFATGTAMAWMCRQVGIAIGVAVTAAFVAVRPDAASFRSVFLLMAVCGLATGLALFAIKADRPPAVAGADARREEVPARLT